jgi:hypothetical protein
MQSRSLESGSPLSPRDLMIAATARAEGKELAVSDTDGLRELLTVRKLGPH